MSIRRFKFIIRLIIPILVFFLMSQNVAAVSVGTSSFDLHYKANSSSQYTWQNGILYGSSNGITIPHGGGINQYQFTTSSIQAGGSSASIHFETNIVSTWYFDYSYNPWVNLTQQNVIVCNSFPSAATTISRNLATATTLWGNRQANTLTLYADVTVSGLTAGTNYVFTCAIGSSDYSFYDVNSTVGSTNVWFEQNPINVSWFTDESQALLQTQINQNETIINLNQQMINNQNQNTQDIISNQNQNAEDIIKSNQRCHNSYNLFNKSAATSDVILNWTTGGDVSNSGSITSDFISVNDGDKIKSNFKGAVFFYDSSKSLIGHFSANGSVITSTGGGYFDSFTVPSDLNISYFRISFRASTNLLSTLLDQNIMVNSGDVLQPYEPFGEEICTNFTQEYNDKQYEAWDNISGQSSNDIDGATNQQTTNLIGTISSFVSALSSINTNGSCQLTLPFPNLLGGSQTVNPCTGADKAPTIVAAASSLLLITVFVPLAFILVKMIYNEIRSFTNG